MGNKRDLVNLKEGVNQEIEEFAKVKYFFDFEDINGVHVKTSAMSGIGVDYLFEKIIEKLMEDKMKDGDREISEVKEKGIRLRDKRNERKPGQEGNKKKGCC